MRTFGKTLILLLCSVPSIAALEIDIDTYRGDTVIFVRSDEVLIIRSVENRTLRFIRPIQAAYSNISDDHQLEAAIIEYHSDALVFDNKVVRLSSHPDFGVGTFYISWGEGGVPPSSWEPIHQMPDTLQIVVRPDDSFHGFLFELINTPFIYLPMGNRNGVNQVENRIGSDCHSFVTYGLRRLGYDIPYTNPISLLDYLDERTETVLLPHSDGDQLSVYVPDAKRATDLHFGPDGESGFLITDESIERGLIISFREQISVLYEDRGIPGILDSEDLLLQSWFDGPHITSIRESGFFGYPLRVFSF